MTDLPPVQYLDEAARVFGYTAWGAQTRLGHYDHMLAHARALHRIAELEAKLPKETLEDVARREAIDEYGHQRDPFVRGFLRCHAMMKAGELPNE